MNADIQLDYFKKSGAIPGSLAALSNELISKDTYIVNWNASLGCQSVTNYLPSRTAPTTSL